MSNVNEIVKYDANGVEVTLSKDLIKQYFCPNATDEEAVLFLKLCQAQRINPFLREAYLVKYGDKTQMIVGKDFFVKRAKENPTFRGFRAGIIVERKDKGIQKRSGTFYGNGEQLVGAFCEVYIKGWDFPLEHTVSYGEFKKNTSTWNDMPATMLRKVALVQALREAFPEDFRGLYSEEEMPVDSDDLPREPIEVTEPVGGVFEKDTIDSEDTIEDAEIIEVLEDTISGRQQKHLFDMAGNADLVRTIMTKYGYEHSRNIKVKDYDGILQEIQEAKDAVNGEVL